MTIKIFYKDDEAPPPAKRLAIVEEREEDKYTHTTELKCWLCDSENGKIIPDGVSSGKV
jgi:ubiquitin carboxyl-terminal hydrolase 5/13